MTLKLTWKQVDKYVTICERWNEEPQLHDIEYSLVVKEEEAQPFGSWFGPGNHKKPGSQYIVIQPDGYSGT